MFKRFASILLIAGLILSMGCTKKEDPLDKFKKDLDYYYGKVDDGVFNNDYVEMSLNVPEDWNIVEDQVRQQMEVMAAQLLAEDSEALADIDLEEIRVYNMLFLFKYPLEKQEKFNPSMLSVVERFEDESVENAESYLKASKALMETNDLPMGFKYVFVNDLKEVDIAGQSFTVMEVYLDTGVSKVTQKFYAKVVNDKVINFMLSFSDETEEKELMDIFETLKL